MASLGPIAAEPLSTIGSKKPLLVQLEDKATVAEALGLMLVHDITSLPVYSVRREYLGIVSMFDLALVIAFGEVFDAKGELNDKFMNLEKRLGDLVGVTPESKQVWVMNKDDPVSSVFEPMRKGIHHVLVRDAATSEFRMVSQSDLVRRINEQIAQVGPMKKEDLQALGFVQHFNDKNPRVVTVKDTLSAIDGFKKMWTLGVQALAVVNAEGDIVGSLSSSDLRGLTAGRLRHLKLPMAKFQEAMRGSSPAYPVCVTPKTSLQDAIKTIVEAKVHRVFIVDGSKPVGVLSLTDIIDVLTNPARKAD